MSGKQNVIRHAPTEAWPLGFSHYDHVYCEQCSPYEILTTSAVAELLGIQPTTWRAYVSRAQAPEPDGHHDARTPYWYQATIDTYRESRTHR